MTTITDQVINFLASLDNPEFTVSKVLSHDKNFKVNTIRTIVSRDLVRRGFVTKKDRKLGGGKERIYIFNDDGNKPKRTLKRTALPKKQKPEPKPEPDSYDSYVKIGRGIEDLLEEKNQTIMNQTARIQGLKRQLMDTEATVQERDRHIVEQGKKIHELSEKIRSKSGGSIKLDELQRVVNGGRRRTAGASEL